MGGKFPSAAIAQPFRTLMLRRRLWMGLVGVAVAASLLLLPGVGQAEQEVVRLRMTNDGSTAAFIYGSQSQALIPTSRCEVKDPLAGPLVVIDGNRKPGLNAASMGIKSGGSQGVPCGRVDTIESLTIAIDDSVTTPPRPLAGRSWNKLELDLELKGSAWVILKLRDAAGNQVGPDFQLASGSSIAAAGFGNPGDTDPAGGYTATSTATQPGASCAGLSDSGPDAGANDNCRWTVVPGVEFVKIELTAKVGEFSLEGSGDYGNDPAYDSLFYLSNRAPVADDDTYTTDEDTPLTVAAPGVLDGDTDGDGDTLSAAVLSGTSNGTLALGADGGFTYTPAADFHGTDAFTYTVTDGNGGSDTGEVTITVSPVNDAPVAAADAFAVDEGTTLTVVAPGVLGNDNDVDGDALTAAKTSDTTHGTVTLNTDGSFTYTPSGGFFGTDSFTYRAGDGTAVSNEATVTITVNEVNDPPTAVDDEASTPLGTAVSIDVLANDTDPENDTLTVSDVGTPSDGQATITSSGANVSYTPNSGFEGTDSFTYTVSDGNGGTDTATVTVAVHQTIDCGVTYTETIEGAKGPIGVTVHRGPNDPEKNVTCEPIGFDLVSNTLDGTRQGVQLLLFGDEAQLGALVFDEWTIVYAPIPATEDIEEYFQEADETPVLFPWCGADGSGGFTFPSGFNWCRTALSSEPVPTSQVDTSFWPGQESNQFWIQVTSSGTGAYDPTRSLK